MSNNNRFFRTNVEQHVSDRKLFRQMYIINENDRKILKILSSDPRLSYREIARRTKLSVGTVINRMRQLKESGVFRGFHTDIDAKKLGYESTAVIEIVLAKGLVKRMSVELARIPNIYGIYEVAGPYDTVIVGKFKDSDELSKFLRFLQSKDYVQKTETRIVLKTIKEDFRFIVQ